MLFTWPCTAQLLMPSVSALSLTSSPLLRSARISRSRGASKAGIASKARLAVGARRQGTTDSRIRLDEHYTVFQWPAILFGLERAAALARLDGGVSPGERVVLPTQRQRQLARKAHV